MEETQICRLCLQSVPKFEQITNYLRRKFVFISSQHKIDICSCCKWYACNKCLQELDSCCSFKQTLVETEEKILNVVRHQPTSRNLKSMLNIDNTKQDTEICRLCLKVCNEDGLYLFESKMNNIPFKSIKRVCDDIFSMDFNLSDEPIMCYPCWESLQKAHTLIKVLLKTQLAIDNFLSEKKINKLESEDLKNIKIIDDNIPQGQIQIIEIAEDETNSGINNVDKEELSPKQNKIHCDKEPHLTEMAINDFDIIELSSSSCESNVEPVQTSSEAIPCTTENLVVEESFVDDKMKMDIDNVDSSDCIYNTDSVDSFDTSLECDTGNKEDNTVNNSKEKDKKIVANACIFDESAKVYRCKKCDFTTPYIRNAKRHEKTAIELHQCHRCSYTTCTRKKLMRHQQTHQAAVVKIICRYCKIPCKTIKEYKIHKIKMHPEKCWKSVTLHQCDLCSYSSTSVLRFKEHRVIHGDTDENEKLSCTECEYITYRKNDFSIHMRRHPRMKLYPCHFCKKKFSKKGTLLEHTSSEHADQFSR